MKDLSGFALLVAIGVAFYVLSKSKGGSSGSSGNPYQSLAWTVPPGFDYIPPPPNVRQAAPYTGSTEQGGTLSPATVATTVGVASQGFPTIVLY